MTLQNFTHLKQLEAESIHIMREVVAEFDNPVIQTWKSSEMILAEEKVLEQDTDVIKIRVLNGKQNIGPVINGEQDLR